MDSLFITTGYAGSGWDLALFACSLDAYEGVDADQLSSWRDQMAARSSCGQALELRSEIDPDASMLEVLDQWLSRQDYSRPLILADERDFWLLDVWAARCPQARFLLFYTAPETALIQALLRGDQPDDFLSGWRMAARHLIGFQRRYRRRALLLDADSARLDPQGMVEAVRGLGLELSLFDRESSAPSVELPLERMLVRRWLDMQPDLPLLQAELEAHALPLADRPPQPDPDPSQLVEHYLRERAQRSAERDVQERLIAEKEEGLAQARERLSTLEADYKDSKEENELLLLQLHQVQEELESQFLSAKEQEASLIQARDEQARRVAERDSELSQARGRLSMLEADHKDIKEENELLLLQLHQVQEELEQYFLKYQALVPESSDPTGSSPPERSAVMPPRAATRRSVRRPRPPALKFRGLFAKNRKERKRLERYIAIIKESRLFDEEWYLRQYPDVAEAGFDPVEHYVCHGVADRRNPSSWFDTHFYMTRHPDVAGSIMNPLVHYHRFGQAENRQTRPGWNG
ncbi:hypothetical protein ThidrDRAFT_3679 [Thiorhodococcus drewsii AZ1]|uniref:Uncharacterized protein n=1 Tax=Thiorhodococcus drewsii AZ1 TaxID=765913 RepID=G2E5W6_9GAMM|nr:hypothetical protein [Thiorhodococcus drewsii]EGV28529.1 hypothetical protein ThidrDRAFT_3679 [Thiorhodococcus drewsii AZ1]